MMETQMSERRDWAIDERLTTLVGCPVRVRAERFSPKGWSREAIHLRDLILPEGSRVHREPVFVEGTLREFTRQVGVVLVSLDALLFAGGAEGRVVFRGRTAVILRAPATVELHPSHFVEKLPANEEVYWSHLAALDGQMELPLGG
jgi:hypothetical protein